MMKAKVIRIGNSRGIRIPKSMLEACGLAGAVELEARKGCLLVRPLARPRKGWREAFRRMAGESHRRWDPTEWRW